MKYHANGSFVEAKEKSGFAGPLYRCPRISLNPTSRGSKDVFNWFVKIVPGLVLQQAVSHNLTKVFLCQSFGHLKGEITG